MSVILGGVSCEEMRDGFGEGVDDQGPHASKKFLCVWSGRYAVANALLGLSSGTGPSGSVNLTAPQQYPESNNMFAREISIEGAGKCTQGSRQLQFEQAIITCNYGVPQFGYLPLPNQSFDPSMPFIYASQELDYGFETITVENSALKLANGNDLPGVPYGFRVPHVIMNLTLHRVPYLPSQAIVTASQKPINNTTFLGVSPGYLTFQGAKSHTEASTDGTYTQNLGLAFAYRPILRWDEVFDPNGTGGPQQVRYNGAAIVLRSNLATLIPSAYGGLGP